MSTKSSTSLLPGIARELCVLLLVMLFAGMPFAAAQAQETTVASSSASLWGTLNKGQYGVGYRMLYAFDPSRTWRSEGPARP